MERKVNQKEFNDLVKENVEEFEMEEEEAIEFAVSQLKAQDVNLSNVITDDVAVIRGEDDITQFCTLYKNVEETDHRKMKHFVALAISATSLAEKNLRYKMFAGEMGVHTIILNFAKWKQNEPAMVVQILPALENSIKGYPDLIDEDNMLFLMNLFTTQYKDDMIQRFISSILVESIKRHERNKQIFYASEMGLIVIKMCLQKPMNCDAVAACDIITNLCRDDDPRVEISNAHSRALSLSDEFLFVCFTKLRSRRRISEETTAFLRATTAMAVTNLLVKALYEDDPEFNIPIGLINHYRKDKVVLYYVNKLLVALSGNDDCKSTMTPLIPLITAIIDENLSSPRLIKSSFLLTASLSLRSPTNAVAFIELNAVEKIIQAMKVHEITKLRKQGCMALRNLASSSKMIIPFRDAGVLDLMSELLDLGEEMMEECKSVLVALGAPVTLDEQWTGERGDVVGGNENLPGHS